ncbi:MAG: MaoC/PaaZ C-terminal domain-containing protein [Syntrophomonadaceae bacterium]|jgi:acyl dehydratase
MNQQKNLAFWEDFIIGDKRVTPGRTITEADIVNFAGFTGSYDQEHVDQEFAKNSVFGERIGHGLINLCVAEGLRSRIIWYNNDAARGATLIAFLGLDKLSYPNPIRINDTLRCEIEVLSKRETQKEDRGIVVFQDRVINQRGEITMQCQRTVMYRRRPKA